MKDENFIKKARKQAGYTVKDVANATGQCSNRFVFIKYDTVGRSGFGRGTKHKKSLFNTRS